MSSRCIVAGTDGSESATESVSRAARLAAESDAVLHLVGAYRELTRSEKYRARHAVPVGLDVDHVADPWTEMRDILDDTAYALRDLQPRLWLHAVEADPGTALSDVAARKGAELVVVGNRGIAHPLRRFRPPVCDQVRNRARCQVMVVDTSRFWSTTDA